jgi:hypothetical protein
MKRFLFGCFGLLLISASLTFGYDSKGPLIKKSPGVELSQSVMHFDASTVLVADCFAMNETSNGSFVYALIDYSFANGSTYLADLHRDPGRSVLMTYFNFNKTTGKNPLKHEFGESSGYSYSYRSSYSQPINQAISNSPRIYDIGHVREGFYLNVTS